MDLSQAIRIRIKNLIEERNLNISKLSTLAGISRSTLSKFMSGQRKIIRLDMSSAPIILIPITTVTAVSMESIIL